VHKILNVLTRNATLSATLSFDIIELFESFLVGDRALESCSDDVDVVGTRQVKTLREISIAINEHEPEYLVHEPPHAPLEFVDDRCPQRAEAEPSIFPVFHEVGELEEAIIKVESLTTSIDSKRISWCELISIEDEMQFVRCCSQSGGHKLFELATNLAQVP
jgi:hypothetical protein